MAAGKTMEVHLPTKVQNQSSQMRQVIEGPSHTPGSYKWLSGLVPGAAANPDTPFLYLDRPLGMGRRT